MEVKLIGSLDYKKIREMLKRQIGVETFDEKEKDKLRENIIYLDEEINTLQKELQDNNNLSSSEIEELNKSIYVLETGKQFLQRKLFRSDIDIERVINELQEIEKMRKSEIVASAGRLSRFAGDVLQILELSESKTLDQNVKFASIVTGMGHESIADHDYCVFAIKDVSPIVEQTIIEERYSSFTIKSRREVNFSNVGFYVPDFHDKDGNLIPNNENVKEEYIKYMKSVFSKYQELIDMGVPIEDARFILPYSYNSNIIMGMDAHSVKNLIIKLTKTKYSRIQELREFGEKLYNIAKEYMPYLIESIDKYKETNKDLVEDLLDNNLQKTNYQVLDKPKLLNKPEEVDKRICIAAIMRRFQYDYNTAEKLLDDALKTDNDFMNKLIKTIAFEGDSLELTQVNFDFQIPLSLAILTHLTRHRTHNIMTPDFAPNIDLAQYKTPPTIKRICNDNYNEIFRNNINMYNHFKNDYKIRDEDLVYFAMSGNTTNSITNMDGKTLKHILALRECNKAQWETRNMAYGLHREIDKIEGAEIFSSILGASCTTQGICNEGRECCGKVYKLPNCKMPKKIN